MSDIYDAAFPGILKGQDWNNPFADNGSTFICWCHSLDLEDVYPVPHVPGCGGEVLVCAMHQRCSAPHPGNLQSPPKTPNLAAGAFAGHLGSCASSPYNIPQQADCYAEIPGSQRLALQANDYCSTCGENYGGGSGIFSPAASYTHDFVTDDAYRAPAFPPVFSPGAAAAASPMGAWMPAPASPASPASIESIASTASPKPVSAKPRIVCGLLSTKGGKSHDCRSSFTQIKDLTRHRRSRHPKEGDPSYRCRCGSKCVRKDNHVRHVNKCSKQWLSRVYACICEHGCPDKNEHLTHVKDCQHNFGHRGRPSAS